MVFKPVQEIEGVDMHILAQIDVSLQTRTE